MNDFVLHGRFHELFKSFQYAYNVCWPKASVEGQKTGADYKCVRDQYGLNNIRNHLEGKTQLGLTPTMSNSKCFWGCIDVDIYSIDHVELAGDIKKWNLPLIVCHTKSSGAHLYTFFKNPVEAHIVRKTLKAFCKKLGLPLGVGKNKCEIFPKENTIKKDSGGNPVNLPYFNSNQRVAIDSEGSALSLKGFLDCTIDIIALNEENPLLPTEEDLKSEIPPCLEFWQNKNIPDGSRNELMFNFGVYFQKLKPDTWEDVLFEFNTANVEPQLSVREIATLISSIKKNNYSYKCDLVLEWCDKNRCLQSTYGKRGINSEGNSSFSFTRIQKITSEPVTYLLHINGAEVPIIGAANLMKYNTVRSKIVEHLDFIPPALKDMEWQAILNDKLSRLEVLEIPFDGTCKGMVLYHLLKWFEITSDPHKPADMLLKEMPVELETRNLGAFIAFIGTHFMSYLNRQKSNLKPSEVWVALRSLGCEPYQARINNHVHSTWRSPYSTTNMMIDIAPGVVELEI